MKKFTIDDQKQFSELSGDMNPVHLDEIYARRTIWGKVIVHGINQVIWGLNEWLLSAEPKNVFFDFADIKVDFIKALGINEYVKIIITDNGENANIQIKNIDDIIITTIIFSYIKKNTREDFCFEESLENIDQNVIKNDIESLQTFFEYYSQNIYLNKKLLQKLYPHVYTYSNLKQISLLLNTTSFVGNKCPGLYSIFTGLELKFIADKSEDSNVKYLLNKIHKILNIVIIRCESIIGTGLIKTIIRPSYYQQGSLEMLYGLVSNSEFKAQKALIIGGSRGIGEVVLKILLLGGANVLFTYFKGKEDAKNIVNECNQFSDRLDFANFDVLNPSKKILEYFAKWKPTHVYYFATPPIFEGDKKYFSFQLYTRFSEFYLNSFIRLVNVFLKSNVNFFYPSTSAINEFVDGMKEYSMTKYSGELLCEYMNRINKNIYIFAPRLPRLLTDQTMTILPVKAQKTEEYILPLLKKFNNMDFIND